MRLIEVTFPAARIEKLAALIEQAEPDHFRIDESGDCAVARVFFSENGEQGFVDAVQALFEREDGWRLLVLPVEASAPKIEESSATADRKKRREIALREEIYDDVAKGAELTPDFFVLTIASTVVAAIGLNENNVAAVIGAMVIAPLLGPILAITFGATLGDISMLTRAARSAAIGSLVGVGAAAMIGLVFGVNLESHELMSRVIVGLDSIALALAAGVAAALSIVAGAPSALVGVMVAVALLPPAAAVGLFAGAGEFGYSARAILLLFVNVICIMIASQCVFFWKKVRPRTWLEKRAAKHANRIHIFVLVFLLAAAAAIIIFADTKVIPQ